MRIKEIKRLSLEAICKGKVELKARGHDGRRD